MHGGAAKLQRVARIVQLCMGANHGGVHLNETTTVAINASVPSAATKGIDQGAIASLLGWISNRSVCCSGAWLLIIFVVRRVGLLSCLTGHSWRVSKSFTYNRFSWCTSKSGCCRSDTTNFRQCRRYHDEVANRMLRTCSLVFRLLEALVLL